MATTQSITTRIMYNGVDLTEYFTSDESKAAITTAVEKEIQKGIRQAFDNVWSILINDLVFNYTVVGVRPAARQSCLWRHSFNWRNRKRGHPVHRGG